MPPSDPPPAPRLLALDLFRGLTVAGMILVNNPGDWGAVHPQLRHAPWHGWTLTDLVFPFFLWISGVALSLALAKARNRGDPPRGVELRLMRRAAVLIGLGLLLAGFPFGLAGEHAFQWATLRIPGVLQRIALCGLLAGLLVLHTRVRTQGLALVGLLAGYWLLLTRVPVPGHGAGVLEPVGNLAWYLDSTLLAGHTWRGAPAPGFDPEGLLSTLPALATTLAGVLAGHWLRAKGNQPATACRGLALTGLAMAALGLAWDPWFPINKNLWTSSFALLTAGLAQAGFAALHWVVAVRGWSRWALMGLPMGRNALLIYVLSGLLARLATLIQIPRDDGTVESLKAHWYGHLFAPHLEPVTASLLYALAWVAALQLLAWLLHRRGWILTA